MQGSTQFDLKGWSARRSGLAASVLGFAMFVVAGGPVAAQSSNDIFMCVDSSGNRTFTNVGNTQGCRRLEVAPVVTVPATTGAAPTPSGGSANPAARAAASPTPPNFPRVDAQAQRERDDTRQQLLQAELDREQARLDDLLARETELGTLPADAPERAELAADLRRVQASIIELQRELTGRR